MTRLHPLLLSFAVVFVLALNAAGLGQTSGPPAAGDLRDSGVQPWVVIQGSLQDFTGKSDRIVADFAARGQAQDCAARLNQAEKEATKWLYAYRERRLGKAAVAGKTFQGKIDKYSVVIRFAEGGEFTVGGEMQGPGQWTQTSDGLLLETPISTYRGNVEADRITGVRFVKDGSGPMAEWSVKLCQSPNAGPTGRWVQETKGTQSATTVTLVLRPDKTGMWLHDFDYMTPQGGMVRSRLLILEVRWRLAKEPETGNPRDGILLEHVRGDQPWVTQWLELSDEGLAFPWKRSG
jgi:hypothetical protein